MNRRNLPLSALRSFEATARHLHMGKAGEALGVTHGAVSHQIRSLEDKLGAKLFIRAHNTLELTPTGTQLLQAVTEGLDKLQDGLRYLAPEALGGRLIIGCTQTIGASWAPSQLHLFYQKYPTIEIEIQEIKPRQRHIPRNIDVAICYGAPEVEDRSIRLLARPLLYPVCNPALLANRTTQLAPKHLFDYTLVHDGQVSWANWMQEYQLNITDAKRNMTFPNTSQAVRAAVNGAGVALANTLETKEYIDNGQLIRFIEKPIEEAQSYYLLGPAKSTLKSQLFINWMVDYCHSMIRD